MGLWSGWRSTSVQGYQGPVSDHFNGERFTSGSKMPQKSLWTVLKWRANPHRYRWPEQVPSTSTHQRIADAPANTLRLTFVNHATWLIQMNGLNILTDPIWSQNAGPTSWLGPKRVRLPGVRFEDLPRIDAVLISHNHYDHMDLPTLKQLDARDHPLIVVGLGNKTFLEKFGLKTIQEVDWWQSISFKSLAVQFMPSRHWSRRGWDDINKTLWGGYIVQGTQTVYFAGDTGYGNHFKTIHARFPKIDAALLSIGAYEPRWFMKASHLNPEEAVQAHLDLGARQSFGMHFGTFQMSEERIDQPAQDIAAALQHHHLPAEAFVVPEFGRTYLIPHPAVSR
jgi:L-ascorbate metabolism protein UlaG (beta-lactamase superfamily)